MATIVHSEIITHSYLLPRNVTEDGRLDHMTESLKVRLGGLVIRQAREAVDRALKKSGETPTIVDIGTGSGAWAVQMAQQYPQAQVTGLDIKLSHTQKNLPDNCKLAIYDINHGVGPFANSFDVVHSRAIMAGVKDYRSLLDSVAGMLRPGGVYLGAEVDYIWYDEDKNPVHDTHPETHEGPEVVWHARMIDRVVAGIEARNPGCFSAAPKIPGWLQEMDCWQETGSEDVYMPVGDWNADSDEVEKKSGVMWQENIHSFAEALSGALEPAGHAKEKAEDWCAKMKNDVKSNKHRLYSRFRYVWAVKKH